jgi:hypothetical protein
MLSVRVCEAQGCIETAEMVFFDEDLLTQAFCQDHFEESML